jgi:diguanylate cyclase (GGDEF)-like protein/PAS domain S-box-containing protein
MIVHKELLESALDSLPEGIALLTDDGAIVFWNRAAQSITGYNGVDLLARPVPEALEPLLGGAGNGYPDSGETPDSSHGALVAIEHKQGHPVQAMARVVVLRDGLGSRLGTAAIFHPAESIDALPHGECGERSEIGDSLIDLEDRLATVHEDFAHGGMPFGVLWISVDQARGLRQTHGVMACEAMLEKVERAIANGLRPAEALGRWGEYELLAISHERTPQMLAAHAQTLAGLARTADFRWWGDRVSLTVSIGAAQAESNETLEQLLDRAQEAMVSSFDAGGNQIALAPGRQACSPS